LTINIKVLYNKTNGLEAVHMFELQ